jgi:hypothetical protein
MTSSESTALPGLQEEIAAVAHYLPAFGALVRESCGNVEQASAGTVSRLGNLAFHSKLSAETLKTIVAGSTKGGAGTKLDECPCHTRTVAYAARGAA